MLVTPLPSDLWWKNNSILQVKSAMLGKKKSCLNIYICLNIYSVTEVMLSLSNHKQLGADRNTDTLWNPVLFSTFTLQNYKGLLLAYYCTGLYPKSYRHSWKWKVVMKVSWKCTIFPLELEGSGNTLQCVIWNLSRSNKRSGLVHSFPTT